tara:strand:+ start:600 stop:1649 length:1050 start_codon:yes stop_codon:yes gene_type:complete
MAISSAALSPKDFRVAIQPQTALGTALTNGMLELNVDSISHGTLGGVNNYDVKSGGGRILQDEHYFHQNSDFVSEITLSGIYTVDTCFPMLENITGDTSEPFTIASNYSPTTNIKTGATLTAGNSELLTLAIMPPDIPTDTAPSDSDVILYKDCVVTAFSWNGDMGTDGGLVKYSVTFKTYSPVGLEVDGSGYTITPYTLVAAQTLTMGDWQTPANRAIGGQADVMVNSFTMNLENDAVFMGRGASGVPEAIGRGSEFSATADINVKYDDESADMLNMFQAATSGATTGNTIMSNASTPATGASWGFQFPQSVFTSVALSEGDVMAIDASVKMVGYGNGTNTTCATIAD